MPYLTGTDGYATKFLNVLDREIFCLSGNLEGQLSAFLGEKDQEIIGLMNVAEGVDMRAAGPSPPQVKVFRRRGPVYEVQYFPQINHRQKIEALSLKIHGRSASLRATLEVHSNSNLLREEKAQYNCVGKDGYGRSVHKKDIKNVDTETVRRELAFLGGQTYNPHVHLASASV